MSITYEAKAKDGLDHLELATASQLLGIRPANPVTL